MTASYGSTQGTLIGINPGVSRPFYIHPLVLYLLPWLAVGYAYTLGWSDVLLYTSTEVWEVLLLVMLSIAVSWIYWASLMRAINMYRPSAQIDLRWLQKCTRNIWAVWIALTMFEIAVSGGVPLVWLLTGSSKNYFDFGIQSFHGFTLSMLFAATTMSMALGFLTGRRRYFLLAIFALAWSVVTIGRNTMFVIIVQLALIFLQYRRASFFKLAAWGLALFVLSLLAFGIMGDLRSPSFIRNAAISSEYPEWLPNGAIWGYLYLTSPFNNLIYTMEKTLPNYDWSFPLTIAQLIPSIIRYQLFPGVGSDELTLVSQAFNAGTAHGFPYQDYGFFGIWIFSWVTMGMVTMAWKMRNVFGSLVYALFGQCAIFSIFFNHFLALPIFVQLLWFILAVRPVKSFGRGSVYASRSLPPIRSGG